MKNILKNKLNIFLLIVFIIIILGTLIKLDYYPILSVNNQIITAKKLNIHTKAALNYYKNYLAFLNQNLNSTTTPTKNISREEAEVIILNQLIDQALIHQEIKKRLGKDLNKLVEEKIKNYLNPQIEKASKTIYNLNINDFKKEILIPQAEKDLLKGQLFLENKNINNWLSEIKKKSQIKIFTKKFKWTGQKIELK